MNEIKRRGARNASHTKLKSMRLAAGLTQLELATRAGINKRTLEFYEQGAKPLEGAKLDTILKICLVLRCHVHEVIDNEDTIILYLDYLKMIDL